MFYNWHLEPTHVTSSFHTCAHTEEWMPAPIHGNLHPNALGMFSDLKNEQLLFTSVKTGTQQKSQHSFWVAAQTGYTCFKIWHLTITIINNGTLTALLGCIWLNLSLQKKKPMQYAMYRVLPTHPISHWTDLVSVVTPWDFPQGVSKFPVPGDASGLCTQHMWSDPSVWHSACALQAENPCRNRA